MNEKAHIGEPFMLLLNDTIHISDSVSITLDRFTHKRPFVGGATKVSAHLTFIVNETIETFTLSQHGIEGTSIDEDGLTDEERYESLTIAGYTIRLLELEYGKSIRICVDVE